MAGILKTLNLFHNRFLSKCTSKMTFLNIQTPIRTLKSETYDKLSELNMPEKPKKPLIPYLQFIRDVRASVAKDNPHLSSPEIMTKCAEKWKAFTELEKEKYIYKFKCELEEYNDDLLRYNTNLTPEQLTALREVERVNMREEKTKRLRKLNKQFEKPRRPMNPYLRFLNDQGQINNATGKSFMRNMSGEWQKLPDCEKQKYEELFSKEQESYEKDLLEWEKKMFAEGQKELIRKKYVKILEKEKRAQNEHSNKILKNKNVSE